MAEVPWTASSAVEATDFNEFVGAVKSFLDDANLAPMGPISLQISAHSHMSSRARLVVEADLGAIVPLPNPEHALSGVTSVSGNNWTGISDLMAGVENGMMEVGVFEDRSLDDRYFDNVDPCRLTNATGGLERWTTNDAMLDDQRCFGLLYSESPSMLNLSGEDAVQGGRYLPMENVQPSSSKSSLSSRENSSLRSQKMGWTPPVEDILRSDYLQYLQTEMPRWSTSGLWRPDGPQFTDSHSSTPFRGLQLAYSRVCMLDVQIDDGAIRKRMALIQLNLQYTRACEVGRCGSDKSANGVGRSDVSVVIDDILKNLHQGWATFEESGRASLRARFHNRKRYGKRWATLVDSLGPGILFLCSPGLVRIVRNTKVTFSTLGEMASEARCMPEIARVLDAINPVADALLNDRPVGSSDARRALVRLVGTRMDNSYSFQS